MAGDSGSVQGRPGTLGSDEDSYYEVEVTRADGSQIDVQLDRTFKVVGSKVDAEANDT